MTRDIVETCQGHETMASSGPNRGSPVGEDNGGRKNAESSNHQAQHLVNGLTEGAGVGNRTPKLESVSADGENSSRSNQGSMKASVRGDEVAKQGGKRGSRRKGEPEGLVGGTETPQRSRLERSAKRGDSGTKLAGDEINLNEGVVESSMFKQVKFENGAAISQAGSSHYKPRETMPFLHFSVRKRICGLFREKQHHACGCYRMISSFS
jgi:hypothetical protein